MINPTASRQDQILTLLLNAAEGMSIDEIAAELAISRNAVKQHLDGLEKQRLVHGVAMASTGGRPARSYALTEQGINRFPKQYAWFCNLLLSELAADKDEQALEQMMWRLGSKLADSLQPQFTNKDLGERLAATVELLRNLGYHAELELDGECRIIKAVNCVYHDLAQQRPQLCHFDRALISGLLQKPINQTSCMANKDCSCRFAVGSQN